MTEQYIIAGMGVSIAAPDDLPLWRIVRQRFVPFAAAEALEPDLAITIAVGPMPAPQGETIYEPDDYTEAEVITGRARRRRDGGVEMDFWLVASPDERAWMHIDADLGRVEIMMPDGRDDYGASLLPHILMLAFMHSSLRHGVLMFHSSAVMADGRAYLFQGRSGTGKSTHATLWLKNIPGARPLNDDHPLVRSTPEGEAIAYGSPWSGKTACFRNESAPLGALVRIERAKINELRPLTVFEAYASLTASVFYLPFFGERLREIRHNAIERLIMTVPCCEMRCLPDAEAARVCHKSLTEMQNKKK